MPILAFFARNCPELVERVGGDAADATFVRSSQTRCVCVRGTRPSPRTPRKGHPTVLVMLARSKAWATRQIDMSKFPGYAGVEGEGYFDGELVETYLFTDFAVDFVNACRPPKTTIL